MMKGKVLIFSDAGFDQTNGVIVTLINTRRELISAGFECEIITAVDFLHRKQFPCPTYPSIKLVFPREKDIKEIIYSNSPQYIHIATEGPIGFATAKFCKKHKIAYTSSYHTKFPEYVSERFWFIPKSWVYKALSYVHNSSSHVLVTVQSMVPLLERNGITVPIKVWGRGVDSGIFNDAEKALRSAPVENNIRCLYVGRLSVEKSIDDFLSIKHPRVEKIVVGDGPAADDLKKRYSGSEYGDVKFLGELHGKDLVKAYCDADVFVFPSKSDTFGIVMIEANACGLPVAAYPVTGPLDYVTSGVNGYLSSDLLVAILKSTGVSREGCIKVAKTNTWERCTQRFIEYLVPIN